MLSRYTSRFGTIPRTVHGYHTLQSCLFSSSPSDKPFDKILIANRGEIAVRIMNTCKSMGISTVAIHSEADTNSFFVHYADEAICIGPPPTNQSYLQIERIVNACKMTGAQAVHPGFGFLSENNHFAKALEDENIVFIGPRSHAISVMGDKIRSKEAAIAAGTNIIPGDNRVIKDVPECITVANEVGYPIMIKASAGGGGKGMRVAYNDTECAEAFQMATNEAISSFGDGRLFVEKFIEEPRHIEIQILCDTHGNYIHLNERECSIQRRNQKVFEESPSVVMTDELRQKMGTQALDLARAVEYISAGTVEFLVDKRLEFYFLEMNTRLQVEHPVTEYVTGVDLVREMINIAAGKELQWKQSDIGINGWALEGRIYAEDAFNDFVPQIGTVTNYQRPCPNDTRVRTDSAIQEAIAGVESKISPFYDPMIGKLITHGRDRNEAMGLMRDALDSYVIHGIGNNIPFLRNVLDNDRFISGDISTKFIEEEYEGGFGFDSVDINETEIHSLVIAAAKVYSMLRSIESELIIGYKSNVNGKVSEYIIKHGTDKNAFVLSEMDNDSGGERIAFDIVTDYIGKGETVFTLNDRIFQIIDYKVQTNELLLQYKGLPYSLHIRCSKDVIFNKILPDINMVGNEVIDPKKVLLSPMTGNIFSINVKVGQEVHRGMEACIIEAMKMQNICKIEKEGIVKAVYVKQGDFVQSKEKIFEIELLKINKNVEILKDLRDLNKNKMFSAQNNQKEMIKKEEICSIEVDADIGFDEFREQIFNANESLKNEVQSFKFLLLSFEDANGVLRPWNMNETAMNKFWYSEANLLVQTLNEPLSQLSNNARFLNIYFAKIDGSESECVYWPNANDLPIRALFDEKNSKYAKVSKFIANEYDLSEESTVIGLIKSGKKNKEIVLLDNKSRNSVEFGDILVVFDMNKSKVNGVSDIQKYIEQNINSLTLPLSSSSLQKKY